MFERICATHEKAEALMPGVYRYGITCVPMVSMAGTISMGPIVLRSSGNNHMKTLDFTNGKMLEIATTAAHKSRIYAAISQENDTDPHDMMWFVTSIDKIK